MIGTPAGGPLAGRFELLDEVGSGGMGTVYRARDLATSAYVAVKLLIAQRLLPSEIDRFQREARLLAELRHPGIVGYVAHGLTAEGRPYLAMEWLQGEDLAHRVARGPLTLEETLTLFRHVVGALEFAHRAGIVHRDLKPSNLFLRGGQVEQVAVLDFGLARRAKNSLHVTRTGVVMGTPQYMAPEQARGERDLDGTADFFSLACVIHECLTGEPPFVGEHIAAVLGKILFAPPAPLISPYGSVPAALSDLLLSMLAKAARERPQNGVQILARLDEIVAQHGSAPAAPLLPARVSLAGDEQHLLSVLVATPKVALSAEETLSVEEGQRQAAELWALRQALAPYGAELAQLADGSLVSTLLPRGGGATEQVAQAVHCALILRERCPNVVVAVATGRGLIGARLPVGEVLDRAGQILRERLSTPRPQSEPIVLDEVTVALMGDRYAVLRSGGHYTLLGDGVGGDPSRPLLGQPTPCVGRESELAILEGALTACIDEAMPRAVLVVGAPGMGKSRLCRELVRRIDARGQRVQVWLGGCDPLSPGTPYGPLNRALRHLCGVQEGESLAEKQRKLRDRVAEYLPPAEARQTAEFLGQLCGVDFPEEGSIQLRAARQDPRLMADQVTQAVMGFLQAACAVHPVLLLLEDLQWGDALTMRLVQSVLSGLTDAPLLVLSTARPEISEQFPKLWGDHVQPLPLRPLPRKACERMAQQMLHSAATPEVLARIVERAAGNPLWLEELIRAAAEGVHDETPGTVMAMLQARIGQLPGGARQVLRAASVFGETFWQDGVIALLGQAQREDVTAQIDVLVGRELFAVHADSRFPHQRELRFRHTLLRDAAYSLLTEQDQVLGHRLAGAFLQSQGESDQAVLAEHARRGQQPERAVQCYSAAAEGALSRNDVSAALRYARACRSCAPSGEALGLLCSIEATANLWGGELQVARAAGLEALDLLPRGSKRWFQSILALWLTTIYLGQSGLFNELRDRFRDAEPQPDAINAYIEASSFLIVMASLVGQAEQSRYFLSRLESASAPYMATDLAVQGWVNYARGIYCHWIENNLWRKAQLAQETIAASHQIGDRRMRCMALTALGLAQMGMGAYRDGAETHRAALALLKKLPSETYLLGAATAFFSLGIVEQRDPQLFDEAIELCNLCIASVAETAPSAGIAHYCLSRVYMLRGDVARAQPHARQAILALRVELAVCPIAFAALAETLLLQGDLAGASVVCSEGLSLLGQLGECSTAIELLVTAAAVDRARGAEGDARAKLMDAAARLQRSAAHIPDPALRRQYLTAVPLHRQLSHLMAELQGDVAGGGQGDTVGDPTRPIG